MVARLAHEHVITADAVEFIRFCYARRRVGWPELYDEMCAVASRGLFRGWGAEELAEAGVKFGLFEMPHLAATACEIIAEDRARAKAAKVASVSASTAGAPA
ncbi:MAG TPA: hypothetical protein VJ850_02990 [Candidatus Limnocylindrales bacterium]|nr:hypothetical protein [Candidatus Limnocylindrales bacterium]